MTMPDDVADDVDIADHTTPIVQQQILILKNVKDKGKGPLQTDQQRDERNRRRHESYKSKISHFTCHTTTKEGDCDGPVPEIREDPSRQDPFGDARRNERTHGTTQASICRTRMRASIGRNLTPRLGTSSGNCVNRRSEFLKWLGA